MISAQAMLRFGAVAVAPLALVSCGDSPEAEAVAEPIAAATVATPRTLTAANYDATIIGARIEGPRGTEVKGPLTTQGQDIGSIVSFVACPRETATCDPAAMRAGTLYTYVHRVTLGENEPEKVEATETSAETTTGSFATLFRTTRRATGFNGSIGYSRDEAETALGDGDAIGVSSDEGRLTWRVISGEGWTPGATITFWWQSTLPPEGPSEAWEFESGGLTATATAPFPPAEMPGEREPAS